MGHMFLFSEMQYDFDMLNFISSILQMLVRGMIAVSRALLLADIVRAAGDGGREERFDGGSDDRLETVFGKEERDEWPGVEEAREERRLRPPPPRWPRRLTSSASRLVMRLGPSELPR